MFDTELKNKKKIILQIHNCFRPSRPVCPTGLQVFLFLDRIQIIIYSSDSTTNIYIYIYIAHVITIPMQWPSCRGEKVWNAMICVPPTSHLKGFNLLNDFVLYLLLKFCWPVWNTPQTSKFKSRLAPILEQPVFLLIVWSTIGRLVISLLKKFIIICPIACSIEATNYLFNHLIDNRTISN